MSTNCPNCHQRRGIRFDVICDQCRKDLATTAILTCPHLHAAATALGATTYQEAEAKARLWNAAADLLAACEAWVKHVEWDEEEQAWGYEMNLDFDEIAKAMHLAVAKARGAE